LRLQAKSQANGQGEIEEHLVVEAPTDEEERLDESAAFGEGNEEEALEEIDAAGARGAHQLRNAERDEIEQDGEEPVRRNDADDAAAEEEIAAGRALRIEDAGHDVAADDEEDIDAEGAEGAHEGEGEAGVEDDHDDGGEGAEDLDVVELHRCRGQGSGNREQRTENRENVLLPST
jgi:hypothetical protein